MHATYYAIFRIHTNDHCWWLNNDIFHTSRCIIDKIGGQTHHGNQLTVFMYATITNLRIGKQSKWIWFFYICIRCCQKNEKQRVYSILKKSKYLTEICQKHIFWSIAWKNLITQIQQMSHFCMCPIFEGWPHAVLTKFKFNELWPIF